MTEIFLYGGISQSTAAEFANLLYTADEEILIHMNSYGGEAYPAVTISNLLRASGKKTICRIEGICASAATVISSSCDVVEMFENAKIMLHFPSVFVSGNVNETDLDKQQRGLQAVKQSVLQVYLKKSGKSEEVIENLLKAETWLSADEAIELGLCDVKIENGGSQMDKSLIEKLKALVGKNDVEELRAQESARIATLNGARCNNAHINALIDVAISKGDTLDTIKSYISALEGVKAPAEASILKVIQDNLESGAEGVTGSEEKPDKREQGLEMLVKFMKG